MSVGMPELSMPTMSSEPRSIRWWTTEAPTMPPSPMTTTFAFDGNSAIAHDSEGFCGGTIGRAAGGLQPVWDIAERSRDGRHGQPRNAKAGQSPGSNT